MIVKYILISILCIFIFYLTFNYTESYSNSVSNCKLRTNEQLKCTNSDGPLKSYLSSVNNVNDFEKGCLQDYTTPGCQVSENGKYEFGQNWKVQYKNNICDACVPEIYSDPKAYIPCDSPNPGPPDLTGCGLPTDECINEIEKVPSYIKKEDRQQYVYSCNNKCPCMWKYGKDYKMNC